MQITYKEASMKTDDSGRFDLNIQFDGKNLLLFMLNTYILAYLTKEAKEKNSTELIQAAERLKIHIENIEMYVQELKYVKVKKGVKFNVQTKQLPVSLDKNEIQNKIQEALADTWVQYGVQALYDLNDKKKKGEDKGHKQSRSLARTIARSAGKDTTQPSLFSMPLQNLKEELERKLAESPDGMLTRENISQKTSTLALLLVCKYDELPKNEDGSISISDIGGLAEQMKTSVQEMKYMLLYLSGFQYPHVAHYSESKEIGFRMSKLFDIEFFYDQKHEKKIELTGAHLRVEGVLDIVKNVRIKRLQVKPTPQFIRDLKGKGAGYIQIPATNAYLAMCHNLTLMAFKLMNYSMANKPDWKIGEDKLIEALGIQDMLKKQGRPRTQATIGKGLEELKRIGHLSEFQTPAETGGPYTWKCDGKYAISQQEKQQKAKGDKEFISYEDKSIPVEKRRQRYAEYMMKEHHLKAEKAAEKAAEKILE
jgi:hypothetical protein